MEYKVFIFSENVVNGQLYFDFSKFNKVCAKNLVDISQLVVEKFNIDRVFIEEDKSLIIFCENKNLDNLIIKNIKSLPIDRDMIEEQAVIFKKEDRRVIFAPIEMNLSLFDKIFEKNGNYKYSNFRLFGIGREEVVTKLEALRSEIEDFKYKIIYNNLLCDIYVCYKNEDSLIDESQVKIMTSLKPNVYSENDMSLCNIISSLLHQQNLNISILENITQGNIVSNLLQENKDFQMVLKEAKFEDIDCENSEMLVEKTVKFLNDSKSDIAIITYGNFVGEKLEFKYSIADKKEVHLYNSSFKAEKNNCLEMAKNSLLFHLVKKLRQNDFAF